jgi:hypothetical protein
MQHMAARETDSALGSLRSALDPRNAKVTHPFIELAVLLDVVIEMSTVD